MYLALALLLSGCTIVNVEPSGGWDGQGLPNAVNVQVSQPTSVLSSQNTSSDPRAMRGNENSTAGDRGQTATTPITVAPVVKP